MSSVVGVVLVAGVAIIASYMARKKGFSHNQRIVLSAIVIGLLVLNLFSQEGNLNPSRMVMVGVAVVLLVLALKYLRRQ